MCEFESLCIISTVIAVERFYINTPYTVLKMSSFLGLATSRSRSREEGSEVSNNNTHKKVMSSISPVRTRSTQTTGSRASASSPPSSSHSNNNNNSTSITGTPNSHKSASTNEIENERNNNSSTMLYSSSKDSSSPRSVGVKSPSKQSSKVSTPSRKPKSKTTMRVPQPHSGKQLNVMQAMFGECMCTDAVNLFNNNSTNNDENNLNMKQPQYLMLNGIECISLGAVIDEQSPRERVMRTAGQLLNNPSRSICVGYLLDGERPEPPALAVENQQQPHPPTDSSINNKESNHNNEEEEDSPNKLKLYFRKVTKNYPIEQWTNKILENSKRKGFYNNEIVLPLSIGSAADHIKRGEFDLALEVFEEIIQELRENNTRLRHLDDGTLLMLEGIAMHNIGVVHMMAGNSTLAFPAFREAVRVKQNAFSEDHPEVAVSLVEAGIQFFANEQFDDSLVIFNDALKIYERAYGPQSPKVAMVLNNLGCVHSEMGNYQGALGTFQEAYLIQQLMLGKSQNADLDLLHSATILANIGYIKLQVKKYEEARIVLEEALMVQQSVLGDDHKAIKDTLSNMEFANAFHS